MSESELFAESSEAFLERFNGLTDSVLRSVEVRSRYGWFSKPAPDEPEVGTAAVMISCRDAVAGDWTNLHIRISDVVEGRIGELGSSSSSVISGGVKLVWSEGTCFIGFDMWESSVDVAMVRAATIYLAGRRVFWSTTPYDR